MSHAASYRPRPIAATDVELPPKLVELTEQLAENTHDLWALERMAQGWKYGSKRDDAAKEHPCLVPYADLPDSEKRFDRESALGTLKAILALGYVITPPS